MKTKLLLSALLILSTAFTQGQSCIKTTPSSFLKGLNFTPKSVQIKSSTVLDAAKTKQLKDQTNYVWLGTEWFMSGKTIYNYNDQNLCLSETTSYLNDDIMEDDERIDYTYLSNGSIETEKTYNNDSVWTLESIAEYKYNSNNKISEVKYSYQAENAVVPVFRITLSYTTDNQPLEGLAYEIEGGTETLSERYLFVYENNLVSESKTYEMDSEWTIYDSILYTTNADGWVTEEIYYESNGDHMAMTEKYVYSYDTNGNPTSEENYEYDHNDTKDWVIVDKYEYTYDLGFTFNELVTYPKQNHTPEYADNIINMPVTTIQYYKDPMGTTLEQTYKDIFNYTDISANLTSREATGVTIYPNPATEYFMVRLRTESAQLRLFDAIGREVLHSTVSNNQKIMTNTLRSGIFFYQINNGNNITKGELVIK